MIVYFKSGQTCIKTKEFFVIPARGVGSLVFVPSDSIWTGNCHIYPANWEDKVKLSIHIGEIDFVATRSNDYETNEEWKVLFTRKNVPFSYEYESKLEKLITRLSKKYATHS